MMIIEWYLLDEDPDITQAKYAGIKQENWSNTIRKTQMTKSAQLYTQSDQGILCSSICSAESIFIVTECVCMAFSFRNIWYWETCCVASQVVQVTTVIAYLSP